MDQAHNVDNTQLFRQARAIPLQSLVAWLKKGTKHFPSGMRMEGCFDPSCKNGDLHRTSLKQPYFRCWSCGASGDVTKAASLAWSTTQRQAAVQLVDLGLKAAVIKDPSQLAPATVVDRAALIRVIKRVRKTAYLSMQVLQYLRDQRILDAVINEALAAGVLVGLPGPPHEAQEWLQDVAGRDDMEASGLWRSEALRPACAFKPLWLLHGHEALETASITGSQHGVDLRYGAATQVFTLAALQMNEPCFVSSCPLDALRLRVLGVQGEILGLPHQSAWRRTQAGDSPNAHWFASRRKVVVAFGGEPAQVNEARSLVRHLDKAGIQASMMDAVPGCDLASMVRGQL